MITISLSDYVEPAVRFWQNMDSSTRVLGTIFIMCFVLLLIIMKNSFKEHPTNKGIFAFVVSFVIIFLLNKTNIAYGAAFDYLGYDSGLALLIINTLLIAGFIFAIVKAGISRILMLFGALLLGIGLFDTFINDIIYETDIAIVAGIALLVFGFILWLIGRKRAREKAAGIQKQGVGIGTIIKGMIFLAGLIFLFINPIIGGIILLGWLLVVILFRKRKEKVPRGQRGPGFWRRQGRATKDAWKKRWAAQKAIMPKRKEQAKWIGKESLRFGKSVVGGAGMVLNKTRKGLGKIGDKSYRNLKGEKRLKQQEEKRIKKEAQKRMDKAKNYRLETAEEEEKRVGKIRAERKAREEKEKAEELEKKKKKLTRINLLK